MPLRSSSRCVTRRTVMESSTTRAIRARVGLLARHDWFDAHAPVGAHQSADVENDDDAAVAEDRGAGDSADGRDLRAHALHDDFAAADELVGDESGGVFTRAHQDHRHGHVAIGQRTGLAPDVERQVLEAVFLAAVFERRRFGTEMRLDLGARQANHAFDGR